MTTLQVTPEVSSGFEAIVVVFLYFLLVVGIGGFFFSRSRESTADFWIAGGKIPEWMQAICYYAVLASAGSFFGIGGFAYEFGAAFAVLVTTAVASGGLFLMIFLAAPIRRAGVYTVPNYLELRYDSKRVRLVAALIFAIGAWAYLVPQLTAGGITMNFVLPQIGYEVGVVIAALVFALYVSLGGMWAVTWTDFIQGIMMVLLTLLPVPLILLEFGGVGGTISSALANDPEFASSNMPGLSHIGVALVWILGTLSLPQLGQRVLASDSDRTARRSIMWTIFLYITTFSVSAFVVAGAAMATEPNLSTGDHFYYAVLAEFFGPLVQGLGAAGLLAAVMSTTDALLVALSASVSHDLPRIFDVDLTERQETTLGVSVIWLGAASATVIAFDPPGIIATMTTLVTGGLASGLFPALAVGTWWKRANEWGAIAAMIVGFLAYGFLLFGGVMEAPFSEALVAVPLGLVVYVAVSLGTRRPTGDELAGFQSFHSEAVESRPRTVGDD
ncbi:sodium:solute symporter family protein [Halegenticoccus tardaugens]|uniref:sodium:solute symporter family protein n=1 Tax=Halegenticoccus tardaugens TaxID=2071624 RepID=UPI00100A39EE|nr:sodium:solute symporter family protein [Halegenticoccus tardaugens]